MNDELAKQIIEAMRKMDNKFTERLDQVKVALDDITEQQNQMHNDIKEIKESLDYLKTKTSEHDEAIYTLKKKIG